MVTRNGGVDGGVDECKDSNKFMKRFFKISGPDVIRLGGREFWLLMMIIRQSLFTEWVASASVSSLPCCTPRYKQKTLL
jgi:hypothetical protein